jgi:uncharacterized integral membrane protein
MGTSRPLDKPPGRQTDTTTGRHKPDRSFEAKTLAALLLGGLLIAFAVANSQDVEVDFLVTTSDTPLVIVIAIAVLVGVVFGALFHRRSHRRVAK